MAQSQLSLAGAFVQRPEFLTKYSANLDGSAFIAAILETIKNGSGIDLSPQQSALLTLFYNGGRAAVSTIWQTIMRSRIRSIIEGSSMQNTGAHS